MLDWYVYTSGLLLCFNNYSGASDTIIVSLFVIGSKFTRHLFCELSTLSVYRLTNSELLFEIVVLNFLKELKITIVADEQKEKSK